MTDYPDWQRAFRIVGSEINVPISIAATTVTLDVNILSQAANLNVNLAASAITLNVNLSSSSITLNVNITNAQVNVNLAASAITLNVNITNAQVSVNLAASAITLNVNLSSQSVDLNVNIAASAITLNVNLSSQSVDLNVNIAASAITVNIKFTDQSVAVFDAAKWFAKQATQVFVSGQATLPDQAMNVVTSRTVPAGKTMFIVGMGWAQTSTGVTVLLNARLDIAGVLTVRVGSYRGGGITFDTPLRATAGQLVEMRVLHSGTGGDLSVQASFWGYDE